MAQIDAVPDAATLRELADRMAIDDLHSRYIYALNWQDADTVAALFTEDAVFDWLGGIVTGRENIRAEVRNMRAFFGRMEEGDAPNYPARLRHFITNKLIDIQGDEASSLAYWFELNNDNRLRWPYVGAYGHYEDGLRRTSEGWRFTRRKIFNEQIRERIGPDHNPAW